MKKIIFIILLALASINVLAQDARIAHPFLWKSYYNPAYCGSERMYKVDLGAQSTYSYKPSLFLDSHFSMEIPWEIGITSWGAGVKVSNQYQGSGLLNIASISPMISMGLQLYKNNNVRSFLQVGIEFNTFSTKTNFEKMVLTDQLDPYYGLYKDFSEELSYFATDNVWTFDMGVGIYGQTDIRNHRLPSVIRYGFSIFHVTSDKEKSFYSEEESNIYMPSFYNRRFCANVEYVQPIEIGRGKNVFLGGYGIYEFQGGMHDIQVGFNTAYKWFTLGVGAKVERYTPTYTLSNIILTAVYSQWFDNNKYNLKLAYSFEFPITQGFVSETSIHCLSIHFCYNSNSSRNKISCKNYSAPSDAAWYEYSNALR
jgi:hypothetical protein